MQSPLPQAPLRDVFADPPGNVTPRLITPLKTQRKRRDRL